ncbi:MAG: hypothetical protein RL238_836 [Actinomycetota bacterium]|jgi:uncharacterized membrane protein YccF (DUF307 family)
MSSLPPPVPATVKVGGDKPGAGSLLLNLLWFFLSGIWLFIGYVGSGIVMCITIIGIPFGIQSFKLAVFSLWPFGRSVVTTSAQTGAMSAIGNILWFLLAGVWLAIGHAMLGLLLCITIIGIPLGIGNFKLIPLALFPFCKTIVRNGTAVNGHVYVSF